MQTLPPAAEPVVVRSKNGSWYKRHPNGAVTCRILHVGPNRSERLRVACLARREKRREARAAARRPGLLVLDERAQNARRLERADAFDYLSVTRPGVAGVSSFRVAADEAPFVGAHSTGNGHLKA